MEIKTELKEQRAMLQKLQGASVPIPDHLDAACLYYYSPWKTLMLERLLEDEAGKKQIGKFHLTH